MSRVGRPDQPVDNTSILADDGTRLWTAKTGRGAALIICHGGPGLWDMSGTLAATLAPHLRVIRWDQRGCGRSERRGPYSLRRFAADLDAVRRGLGLDRIAVLGHSWGATLGLRYALDHPDRVTALIYVSGTGLGWGWYQPFQRNIAARLAPHRQRLDDLRARDRTEAEDRELAVLQWSAEFTGPDAVRHAEQMATPWFGVNRRCYDDIWSELRRTWREPELVAACRRLAVPVLIVDGAADLRPRWAADSLEQALPAVSRVVLPGASHVPWLDAPDNFSAALLDHLRALVQPGCRGNRTFRAKMTQSSYCGASHRRRAGCSPGGRAPVTRRAAGPTAASRTMTPRRRASSAGLTDHRTTPASSTSSTPRGTGHRRRQTAPPAAAPAAASAVNRRAS